MPSKAKKIKSKPSAPSSPSRVDVIRGFSPVVETGWEAVFQEAKEVGIPIILVDRRADVPEDLYVTHVGSDLSKKVEMQRG